MTLQQMKYLVSIAELGSISAAARQCFVTQPTLSGELKKVEKELGLQIFERERAGIRVTSSGAELISYCRDILEQVEYITRQYARGGEKSLSLSVATHHTSITCDAFVRLLKAHAGEGYRASILEVKTKDILEYVSNNYCDLGVVVRGKNNRILDEQITMCGLVYHRLCDLVPRVGVIENHPLANKASLCMEDLEPYPLIVFDQGRGSLKYYSEEMVGELWGRQMITVSDRDTEFELSMSLNAITICSGLMNEHRVGAGCITIPLETEVRGELGWLCREDKILSPIALEFLQQINDCLRLALSAAAGGDGK